MSSIKRKRDGERKVLDYHDVLLREQDVSLLEGPHWLNDQLISFFFEYLYREELLRGSPPKPPPAPLSSAPPRPLADSVLLLPPATSFLLMHSTPDMAAEVLAPLKPTRPGLVVFAVNDNPEVHVAAGGSHWSLLVFHRPSNTMRHYDSSPAAAAGPGGPWGGNAMVAKQLARAVGPALQGPVGEGAADSGGSGGGGIGGGDGGGGGSLPRLVEVGCMPRQANSYDCGGYLLAMTRGVCSWWMREGGLQGQEREAAAATDVQAAEGAVELWEGALGGWLNAGYVSGLRSELLALIRSKEAEMGTAGAGKRGATGGDS